MVRAPPVDEGLKGLGATPAAAGRPPKRGRYAIVQELADRPDMVGDAHRHRWGMPTAITHGKTGMGCTEVVDRSGQIHSLRDGCQSSRRAARPPCQKRQPFSKRRVQTLNVGGVEYLTARRVPQQGQEQTRAPVDQPMHGATHGSTRILFDHLSNRHLRPGEQPRTSARASLSRPKSPAHRIGICTQAITDEQQRPELGSP